MPSQDEDNDLPGHETAPPTEKKPVTAPAAAAPAAPVVATPAAPKFTHSAYLTRRALEAGFQQADLDENDSAFIQSELKRIDDYLASERATRRAPVQTSQPNVAAPVEKDPLDEINEADFDPRFVAVAKHTKELRETVKQQNERLQQFEERENRRTQTTVTETIDAFFAKRDPKMFGKGDIAQLPKGSVEVQRRGAIVRAAGLAQGDTPRTIDAKLQAAHNLLFPATAAAAAPDDAYLQAAGTVKPAPAKDPVTGQFVSPAAAPVNRIAEWAESQTARPTARNGAPEPKGKHAATQAVARRMREEGMDPGVLSESNEDDDLPGG